MVYGTGLAENRVYLVYCIQFNNGGGRQNISRLRVVIITGESDPEQRLEVEQEYKFNCFE